MIDFHQIGIAVGRIGAIGFIVHPTAKGIAKWSGDKVQYAKSAIHSYISNFVDLNLIVQVIDLLKCRVVAKHTSNSLQWWYRYIVYLIIVCTNQHLIPCRT